MNIPGYGLGVWIARLNPRDCWYWLVGNCLNTDCAFQNHRDRLNFILHSTRLHHLQTRQVAEIHVISKKEDAHLYVNDNLVEQNEEDATRRSQNEGYSVCANQNQGDIEPEDWLDSSSGFDVLVENASGKTEYERDGRELSSQYFGYDYEKNPAEYDPEYPYRGNLHEYKIRDWNPGKTGERVLNLVFPCKRKLLCLEYTIDDRKTVDPRELIKRLKEINGRSITILPRGQKSTYFSHRNWTEPLRQPAWSRQSYIDRNKKNYYEVKREVSSKPVLKKRRIVEKTKKFRNPIIQRHLMRS